MIVFPEPPLDPPEPNVLCKCHFCGEEIYVGEEHWVHNDWPVHLDHFDIDVAKYLGCTRADGRE